MAKNNYVLAEEPAADLAVLEAFAAELEEYIVKDELYRTVRVHLEILRVHDPDEGDTVGVVAGDAAVQPARPITRGEHLDDEGRNLGRVAESGLCWWR